MGVKEIPLTAEKDLDSVKINLHEIELVSLILKAKETSGLST